MASLETSGFFSWGSEHIKCYSLALELEHVCHVFPFFTNDVLVNDDDSEP